MVYICILLLQLSTFIEISTIEREYSFDIYLHIERLLSEVCVKACTHTSKCICVRVVCVLVGNNKRRHLTLYELG